MRRELSKWLHGTLEYRLSMRGEYLRILAQMYTAENNHELDRCINNCGVNADCVADCNGDFFTRQVECPCEVKIFVEQIIVFFCCILCILYFQGKLHWWMSL